jgi:glycosyltransferase involved in cell wall biosynthesis
LLTFGLVALRSRPHVIGGFHLLINALAASVLARIVRARSLYFCVGGPLELLDGGVWAENRLFGLMETPDAVVERELIRSAVRFFHEHGVQTQFHIVPGAIDPQEFCPSEEPAVTDLILIGRLAEIKRIDVFLQAVALASTKLPGLTATIVGDGELRASLEQIARTSGLDGRVRFAGPQARVSDWLRGARVFVLTSDSEGLALSMMEAMMTGLPVIVSNVGDLGDLVEDGVNGYLVPRRHAEKFAARIVEVLSNPARRASLSTAARETALQCALAPISCKWNRILTEWMGK